jgi:hypothetical protein
MNGEGTVGPSVGRAEVRPASDERCAECGAAVGRELVSYRPDPGDPQALVKHFSAIVTTRPAYPRSRARDDRSGSFVIRTIWVPSFIRTAHPG